VNSSNLSLIIAIDHPLMRAGIKEVLSADRLYSLAAIPETGAECVRLIQDLQPHVAIVDVNISHPGAAGVLREAKRKRWKTRICFLTGDQISLDILKANKDGTAAFVNARFPDELRNRLREIAVELRSKSTIPAAAMALLDKTPLSVSGLSQGLTLRQKQIVGMLKTGSPNREIARVLGLAEGTVKVHLHRIYQQVGVSNRTELAAKSFAPD
jgi:two-component system, NarL family, nitrate/nitrite response regulator NarL